MKLAGIWTRVNQWKKHSFILRWFQPKAALGTVSVIVLVVGGYWIYWVLPQNQAKHHDDYEQLSALEQAELITKYRRDSISIMGTIVTGFGAIFLYLNYRKDIGKNRQDARIAEDRLLSERFSKSVEQLGNEDSIHIRLGGIYSLGRLADDSDEMCSKILDLLSAFIREKCPKGRKIKPGQKSLVSIDIKAALSEIWRIKNENREINLEGVNFRYADLVNVKLCKANLNRADLYGADLYGADLSNSQLYGANLNNARLTNAVLRDAELIGAELIDTDLSRTDLSNANLNGANLSNANIDSAFLINTDFCGADLNGAKLYQSVMLSTYLRESKSLEKAQFIGVETSLYAPPYLCGVELPEHIEEMGINPNRDCDSVIRMLSMASNYMSFEEAHKMVDEARKKYLNKN